MIKTKLTKDDYNSFYIHVIYGNIDDVLMSSIKSAYRDVCRTIHGINKNEHKNLLISNAYQCLYKEINFLCNMKVNNQTEFDRWHKQCCDKLISIFEHPKICYGQAQKWINMTIKNILILDYQKIEEVYEFCHIPVDNYILSSVGYKIDVAWSRINNYQTYLNFQQWFREKYDDIPLDKEFKLWLEESKLRKL